MKIPRFKKFAASFLFALAFFIFPFTGETKLTAELQIEKTSRKPANYDAVRVEKVLTADTILLEDGEKIKLIGLSAPEPPKKTRVLYDSYGFVITENDPTTTINQQAFDFARNLMENKTVRLEFDGQKKDRRFRTLAYVYLKDGTFVNAEILRQGLADLEIVPPNVKYAPALRLAYQEARKEKRGLQGD
ncbi:MAG TPA: thermonuclease family protein [Candidatus Omnitrophota bacterium]|nr:thermonuclease family protein [Candidatus Omnitrophota bacterium]HPD85264.1 thermonuclease family protein [Candidatus Omnitrophota bacterium]HRZ04235.1 thermonuclease family protein [Candidatus Omnitrophota bacterium]